MPLYNPPSLGSSYGGGAVYSDDVSAFYPTVTTASSEMIAANEDRKRVTFFNVGEKRVYINPDGNASQNNYMFYLEPGGFYEDYLYRGIFQGATEDGTSYLEIREFT